MAGGGAGIKRVSAFVSIAMESYGPEQQETKGFAIFLLALLPAWNSEKGFRLKKWPTLPLWI